MPRRGPINPAIAEKNRQIAARVRGAAAAAQVQQKAIGAALGYARNAISARFKGETGFTTPELEIIADMCDTTLDALRGVEQAHPPRAAS